MNDIIRILVVDDNQLMRRGLIGSLEIEPDLKVIGEAASGEEALDFIKQETPDVITMDYQMPGDNGVVTCRKILEQLPEARIILLSVFDSEEDVWQAVRAGVKGYLTKKSGDADELLEAIRNVALGGDYFPPVIARKLEDRLKQPDLTKREMEILKLLAEGNTNKEMAEILGISDVTVKLHLSNLREKLGAVDRTQAVVLAYKKGILHI
ncbi:response regulator transcription factor [Verrucomicrobia bacterium S94]|nr:response regulator transcription factor [Verrucomicrobia bacterium S94]